jgi:hypothetical protein
MKKYFLIFLLMACTCSIYAQWIKVSGNISSTCLTNSGSNIFTGTTSSGILISTNNGSNWNYANNGLTNLSINSLTSSGSIVYAGTGEGIFITSNNGTNWNYFGLTSNVHCLAVQGNLIFAGIGNGIGSWGVYRSTNNGTNWIQCALNNYYPSCIHFVNSYVFAGAYQGVFGGGMFRSTDYGVTWNSVNNGLSTNFVSSIGNISNIVFVGLSGTGGVFKSSNYGNNWISIGFSYEDAVAFAVTGTNIFTSIRTGVWLSTNYGTNWLSINEGLIGQIDIMDLLIANNYIFAADPDYTSIWRRPLSEIVNVSVNKINVVNKYELFQNYPNPFNPVTNIKFQVPKTGFVTIKVFDALGKEVQTLVDQNLNAGFYETKFDAGNLSSGIYFYKLVTGKFSDVKKMVVVK